MKKTLKLYYFLVLALIFIQACSKNNPNASPEHQYEVNLWHSKRIDGLKKDTGWLNLVGLYWLEEGENTIGSSDKNKIVFPTNAPAEIGVCNFKRFNSSF